MGVKLQFLAGLFWKPRKCIQDPLNVLTFLRPVGSLLELTKATKAINLCFLGGSGPWQGERQAVQAITLPLSFLTAKQLEFTLLNWRKFPLNCMF